jgi:hypothetical protein
MSSLVFKHPGNALPKNIVNAMIYGRYIPHGHPIGISLKKDEPFHIQWTGELNLGAIASTLFIKPFEEL